MGYVVAGIVILMLAVYAAANVGYAVFAAAMTVVNSVWSEPLVHLHAEIEREALAGLTIRYEVVRQPDTSVYSDLYATHLIRFEVTNASRWAVYAISPACTLAFVDGNRTQLQRETRRERTTLDDTGHISTAVAPGRRISVTVPTAQIRQESPVRFAECRFSISVPWWVWAADVPRSGGRR